VRTAALEDADLDGVPDVHVDAPADLAAELLQTIGPKFHDLPFSGLAENGFVIPNACCHPKFHDSFQRRLAIAQSMSARRIATPK